MLNFPKFANVCIRRFSKKLERMDLLDRLKQGAFAQRAVIRKQS